MFKKIVLFLLLSLVGVKASALGVTQADALPVVLVYEEAGTKIWYVGGSLPLAAQRVLPLKSKKDAEWIAKTFKSPRPGSVVAGSSVAAVRHFLTILKKGVSTTVLFKHAQDANKSFGVDLVFARAPERGLPAKLTDVTIYALSETPVVHVCEFVKTCVFQKKGWVPIVLTGVVGVGLAVFAMRDRINDMQHRAAASLPEPLPEPLTEPLTELFPGLQHGKAYSLNELNDLLREKEITNTQYHALKKQRDDWISGMSSEERASLERSDGAFAQDSQRVRVEKEEHWRKHASYEELAEGVGLGRLSQQAYDAEIDARTQVGHPLFEDTGRREAAHRVKHAPGQKDFVWRCADALRASYAAAPNVFITDTRLYADNIPCLVNALSHCPIKELKQNDVKVLVMAFSDLSKEYIRRNKEGGAVASRTTVAAVLGDRFDALKRRHWKLIVIRDGDVSGEDDVLWASLDKVSGDAHVRLLEHEFSATDVSELRAFINAPLDALPRSDADEVAGCVIGCCEDGSGDLRMLGGNCLCGDVICESCFDSSLKSAPTCPVCRAPNARIVRFSNHR